MGLSHEPMNQNRNKVRGLVIGAVICLILVIVVGGGLLWAYQEYQPPTARGQDPIRIVVARGESVTEIGGQLEQAGLIKNALIFRLYVRYHHAGTSLKAGTYAIQPGVRISEIVAQLTNGDVVPNNIKVTIPEGFTVMQIADRLAADNICTKAAFLNEIQNGQFQEPFVALLPNHKNIKYRLEGYLFPDTYEFQKGESAHAVVNTMLQDFQSHIDSAGIMTALKAKGESLPTLITVASMVEKEAQAASDRPLIASVIENRLKRHMKLQIDATILYILGHRNIVTDKDLQVKDPYNTYMYYGLPPGPIASPGMASIMAALNPAKTNYLYYVAKYDGSGTSYFSSTEAQHLIDIQKSQANLRKYGGK